MAGAAASAAYPALAAGAAAHAANLAHAADAAKQAASRDHPATGEQGEPREYRQPGAPGELGGYGGLGGYRGNDGHPSAEAASRPDQHVPKGFELRVAKIDEKLNRLTAIHADLGRELNERVSQGDRLSLRDRATRVIRPGLASLLNGPASRPDPAGGPGRPGQTGDTELIGRPGQVRDTGTAGQRSGPGQNGRSPRPGCETSLDTPKPAAPGGPLSVRDRAIRITAAALAAVLFIAVTAIWVTHASLNGSLRTVQALDPNGSTIINAAAQRGDDNYLLAGIDPTDTQPPVGSADPSASRGSRGRSVGANAVMIAHVPADGSRVVLLSLPANLLVDRPSCDRYDPNIAGYPGGTLPGENGVPLTSAYRVGGPKCIVKTVQGLTGLAINHFTELDLAGVRDMVDSMSGLVVCVPKPAVDGVLGPVAPNRGKQIMGGDAALAYLRARQVSDDPSGGAGPALRQQMLLSALLTRASSDQVVSSYGTLKALVGAYAAHTLNDNADLDELIPLVRALHDVDQTKVDLVTVPTAPQPDGQGNLVPATGARPLFDQIRTNQALRGEGPAAAQNSSALNAADSAPLPPSQVALTLRNGSAKPKTAVQAADSLRTLGFKIVSLGAAERTRQTVIRASADQAGQAAALAQAVPSAVLQQVPGTKTLDLVIGDSFDGQIQAAPTGSAASNRPAPTLVTAASVSCR